MAARSCVLVLCIALSTLAVGACSNGGGATASAPSTTLPRFVATAPPAKTIVFRGGQLLLAPIGPGDKAAVTAAAAFERCGGGVPGLIGTVIGPVPPPRVELTRATIKDYGQAHGNGSVTPFVGHRLVWIIWYHAVPVRFHINVAKRTSTPQRAVKGKTDVMTFVDARSGRCLVTEGFAPSR